MIQKIGENLNLVSIPRSADLGDYDWYNIEHNGTQVGKARCRIAKDRFTVFSIMIYPEYVNHGYARAVIDHFKTKYSPIFADRVRFTAREFWVKQGFVVDQGDLYVWRHDVETETSLNRPLLSYFRFTTIVI